MPNQGKLLKTLTYLGLSFVKSLPRFIIEIHGSKLSMSFFAEISSLFFLNLFALLSCLSDATYAYTFYLSIPHNLSFLNVLRGHSNNT
jgi:hypothetical protein